MPIYMDRHDLPGDITAELSAEAHQRDLKVQGQFNCKSLTHWFDEVRQNAFCLMEAPDKNAIKEMHDHAHGGVPHKIIEVDPSVVALFLGRFEDLEKSQETELYTNVEPAFRTIMVIKIRRPVLKDALDKKVNLIIKNQKKSIIAKAGSFNGRIVEQKADSFLISFDSVTKAVLCALEIHNASKINLSGYNSSPLALHIGLSAGDPVSEKEGLFEDTIQLAKRLCETVKDQIGLSAEVKDLYESENLDTRIAMNKIKVLHSSDEEFLNGLMDYIEREWRNANIKVDDFSKSLGYSKSQLYRKMISVTGRSPNNFIKEYRLNKALKLLQEKNENISGIAFETGFNTPGYFSKCFQDTFGILPSHYLKSLAS